MSDDLWFQWKLAYSKPSREIKCHVIWWTLHCFRCVVFCWFHANSHICVNQCIYAIEYILRDWIHIHEHGRGKSLRLNIWIKHLCYLQRVASKHDYNVLPDIVMCCLHRSKRQVSKEVSPFSSKVSQGVEDIQLPNQAAMSRWRRSYKASKWKDAIFIEVTLPQLHRADETAGAAVI